MKNAFNTIIKFISFVLVFGIQLIANNLLAQLTFYDGFESGNFTSGNWTVTGNSAISTNSPFAGNYCVQGPGTYNIEKSFSPINEKVVTIEYAMKASQTNRVSVNQYVSDINGKKSSYIAFRHDGYIVAKNGPQYSQILNLQPYNANVWYKIKVIINMVQQTYDVYIDGQLKADDFDFVDNVFTKPSVFSWKSGETSGTGWVDDVSIEATPFSTLPFYDGFESGNFTAENWMITGNSIISTSAPFLGSYCVKGPARYSIEQFFNPILEDKITIEFAIKASQTATVSMNFKVYDDNNNLSSQVYFNHTGYIGAHDGYQNGKDILPYSKYTWYNIKVVLDNSSKTYDVYIDSVLKANDFSFYSSNFSFPSKFLWGSGEGWGAGWVDEISIKVPAKIVGELEANNVILNNPALRNEEFELISKTPTPLANKTLKVCADGSKATKLTFTNNDPIIQTNDIEFRIKSDSNISNVNRYGKFTDYSINGNILTVWYQHPEYLEFNNGSHLLDTIQIINKASGKVVDYLNIEIYRAPIAMIHGLFGNDKTFEDLENYLISNNYQGTDLIYRANYQNQTLLGFSLNKYEAKKGINGALQKARNSNISAGKADVVSHSLGGILSRIYLQENYGTTYNNDIHYLFTLNSPHSGSPLGDIWSNGICNIFSMLFPPVSQTICENTSMGDLGTNSIDVDYFINGSRLNKNIVPSFSIITFADNNNQSNGIKCNALNTIFEGFLGNHAFPSLNDFVAGVKSQKGGLNRIAQFADICHIGTPYDAFVLTEIQYRLSRQPVSNYFTLNGFNPPDLSYSPNPQIELISQSQVIKFENPSYDTIVNPGDTISIELSSSGNVNRMLVAAANNVMPIWAVDTFTTTLTIPFIVPIDAIGFIRFAAAGMDSSKILGYDSVRIKVKPKATLDSIQVYPDFLLIAKGQNSLFSIKGFFSDGVIRDIFDTTNLLVIQQDTSIASINANLSIIGNDTGTVFVYFGLSGIEDSIEVIVYQDTVSYSYEYITLSENVCDSYTSPSGKIFTQTGIFNDTVLNQTSKDTFYAIDLTVIKSTSSNLKITSCDKLISPSGNFIWDSSGIYIDTLINSKGCDSLIIIDLTVFKSSSERIIVSECESYVSPSGNFLWDSTAIYYDTLKNKNGCDSLIIVDLTILKNSSNQIIVSECETYLSPSGNFLWDSTGIYLDTLINYKGCDSIIQVDLTILNSSYSSINPITCEIYISPSGKKWDTSGKYLDTIINNIGCDSIISIDLTILNKSSEVVQTDACDNYLSPSGKIWTKSGIYNDSIINTQGCDSIITFDLTIYYSSYEIINPIACTKYESPSGKIWNSSGVYSDTILNKNTCDSIITINLNIINIDTTVMQNWKTIISNDSNSTYQWIDCNTNSIIPGATNQSFTPSTNGSYAVIVSNNNCTDTSRCILVNSVGISNKSFNGEFEIYPNPSDGTFIIEITYPDYTGNISIKVFDLLGKKVLEKNDNFETTYNGKFDLSGFAIGQYMLRVALGDELVTRKLILLK
jgi:type IX secretion system substrate protein/sialidase-like protein/putative serine esterase DUF676